MYFFKSILALGLATLGASSPVANSTLDARIVRGSYAEAYTANSFCGIYRVNEDNEQEYVCGSTLVAEQTVVSAASCLEPGSNYVAKCGSNSRLGGPFQVIPIDTIRRHPGYGQTAGDTISNNIALGYFKNRIECGNRVRFAEIQTVFVDDSVPTNYRVYGFGRDTFPDGTDENEPTWALKYLESKNYDFTSCGVYFKNLLYYPSVPAGTFCATSKDPQGTQCQLDQGGPLIEEDTGRFTGIVSYVSPYCSLDRPGVYTSVRQFSNWISENSLPVQLPIVPEKQRPWN